MKKKILLLGLVFFSCLFSFHFSEAKESSLSVAPVSGSRFGYSLYWDEGKGSARIERSETQENFIQVGETNLNYYVDYDVKKDVSYTYKVTVGGSVLISNAQDLSTGKSIISDIKINSGATSKAESSVIINFKTDKLAKGQVFYGESLDYANQTEIESSLNQSHTKLIEKLKPNTTYHFKIRSVDKDDKNVTESDDQVYTTPAPPSDVSIFEIIIKALSQAFAGFEKWFRS
jgi:hypothetical protein